MKTKQKNECQGEKQQEQFPERNCSCEYAEKVLCYSLLDAGRLLKMALMRFMSNFEERS